MKTDRNTFFRYFPICPRDQEWGLFVTTAGYVKIAPGHPYPPAGHPETYAFNQQSGRRTLHEFQLHFIAYGRGSFESRSGGRRTIEPGTVFLLFPNEWHQYSSDQVEGWHEYWVGFNGSHADQLLRRKFVTRERAVMTLRDNQGMIDLFGAMLEVMRADRPGSAQILAAMAGQMLALTYASSLAGPARPDPTEDLVRHARSILHSRLDQTLNMEAVAAELKVSYAWLRAKFRAIVGMPLQNYHLQLRIHRAMDLLSGNEFTIRQIAIMTGFEDEHYFSRLFKKKSGKSPTDWRRDRIMQ